MHIHQGRCFFVCLIPCILGLFEEMTRIFLGSSCANKIKCPWNFLLLELVIGHLANTLCASLFSMASVLLNHECLR